MAAANKFIIVTQILHEILESSSSESEEDELFNEILNSPQKIPKVDNYIGTVENYSNDQFRSHFRITWNTFHVIENKYLDSEFSNSGTGGMNNTSSKSIIDFFVSVRFVANKCVYRDISDRFNIAISTAHKIVKKIAMFLSPIGSNIITFPNTFEEKQRLAEDFREISGFPQVVGCIDGTYIPIRTPVNKVKSTYVNRHNITSLTLQGICDSRKRFLDVFTGLSGKIHDARVFRLSFIANKLPTITVDSLFHILGDSAYPLRTYLLTPYKDYGNLTEEQRNYNLKFSQTRVKIENAFGLLKQRFRQLTRLDCNTVETTSKIIIACCVLHNICIDCEDFWQIDENQEDNVEDVFEEFDQHARRLAELKREEICNLLANI